MSSPLINLSPGGLSYSFFCLFVPSPDGAIASLSYRLTGLSPSCPIASLSYRLTGQSPRCPISPDGVISSLSDRLAVLSPDGPIASSYLLIYRLVLVSCYCFLSFFFFLDCIVSPTCLTTLRALVFLPLFVSSIEFIISPGCFGQQHQQQ